MTKKKAIENIGKHIRIHGKHCNLGCRYRDMSEYPSIYCKLTDGYIEDQIIRTKECQALFKDEN